MAALPDARALRPATITLIGLLAACATVVVPPDRSYAGRFAATAARGEQRESVSGRFNLEVRGARQTLDLATPLGTTLARIDVEPGQARATGAQMQVLRGPDADDLTEQLLGWRLPVSGLADWLEGRPAPGRAARIERDAGRIVLIEQDGWTIRLSEASESGARPRRLLFERPAGPAAPAVSLRLILDEPAG